MPEISVYHIKGWQSPLAIKVVLSHPTRKTTTGASSGPFQSRARYFTTPRSVDVLTVHFESAFSRSDVPGLSFFNGKVIPRRPATWWPRLPARAAPRLCSGPRLHWARIRTRSGTWSRGRGTWPTSTSGSSPTTCTGTQWSFTAIEMFGSVSREIEEKIDFSRVHGDWSPSFSAIF